MKMRKKLDEKKWDQMSRKKIFLEKSKKRNLLRNIYIHSP